MPDLIATVLADRVRVVDMVEATTAHYVDVDNRIAAIGSARTSFEQRMREAAGTTSFGARKSPR